MPQIWGLWGICDSHQIKKKFVVHLHTVIGNVLFCRMESLNGIKRLKVQNNIV